MRFLNFKKNKFLIFFFFNIILITFIFILALPFSNYLKQIRIKDNQFVENQIVINPEVNSPQILDRTMDITMNTQVAKNFPLEFESLQKKIQIRIGENTIAKFKATNKSKNTVISTANFFTNPDKINPYLIKTECFCFSEQQFKAGEDREFTMVFYIDPSISKDIELSDLKNVEFTYVFSSLEE
ncbi:MAG: Cytochrome c oxidase assembly protein CtaG [Alphaproteobacteria bacterium MarineAlpha5_Bin9]|nr:MAG: Cytochrome c oxidase assembly protein CtaG [Alphaproteobacteria bacterium MarineAlpha5_Bin9]|tara:strand:+ start:2371 stop:2922 length:552 start_codon:yes stop_codon:yes gene_type:complete